MSMESHERITIIQAKYQATIIEGQMYSVPFPIVDPIGSGSIQLDDLGTISKREFSFQGSVLERNFEKIVILVSGEEEDTVVGNGSYSRNNLVCITISLSLCSLTLCIFYLKLISH